MGKRRIAGIASPWLAAALVCLAARTSATGASPAEEPVDFKRDVQPILARHCHRCHGPDKQESGLRLDLKSAAFAGGDLGEIPIVPGKSGESALMQAVSGDREDLVMPPEGERLTPAEANVLKSWIDQGASWPEETPAAANAAADYWAFRPLDPGEVNAKDAWLDGAVSGHIDAYILDSLRKAALEPSPEAARSVLIRRLYLDLLGMPPSREEIADFLDDDSPTAYERLVDRLLASPRFGERSARHWLDVARFAETNGFETNTPRPRAYHYRDWVIAAHNSDKPYDRFVFEQLAGDSVGADAATGFLVGGASDEVKSPDVNLTAMQRQNELADMVGTTGMAFLGLTVGCARCHNHKFDPIAQKEYYALQAVFAGVRHAERPLRGEQQDENQKRLAESQRQLTEASEKLIALEAANERNAAVDSSALRPPVSARRNIEYFPAVRTQQVRFVIEATNDGGEPCLDELEIYGPGEGANLAQSQACRLASSGDYAGNEKHRLAHLTDGRHGNSRSWISSERGRGWVRVDFAEPVTIDRIEWGRDREAVYADRLATQYTIEVAEFSGSDQWRAVARSGDRLPPDAPAELALSHRLKRLPEAARDEFSALLERESSLRAELRSRQALAAVAYAGAFEQPGATHRLFRGDPMQPREAIVPSALSFGGEPEAASLGLDENAPEQARRAALAKWLVDPKRPIAARVAVNRVWQSHFGIGLVATASDFGANGAAPSHPELLDWLARELMRGGWSLKRLHREIVLSKAYRQSSAPRAEAMAIDADCRLLWRFPPRRLEAEAVRDSVLAASGAIDLSMYGPGYSVFEPNDNYVRVYEPKSRFTSAEWRRMIYMFKVRMEQDAVFGAFDCPDAGQPTPRRGASTTALQAMNLLNSEFMLDQSNLFAARCQQEGGAEPAGAIDRAFWLSLGRAPDAGERDAALALAHDHGLVAVCRALFNANEFVFLP